jgi:hypothetical protein
MYTMTHRHTIPTFPNLLSHNLDQPRRKLDHPRRHMYWMVLGRLSIHPWQGWGISATANGLHYRTITHTHTSSRHVKCQWNTLTHAHVHDITQAKRTIEDWHKRYNTCATSESSRICQAAIWFSRAIIWPRRHVYRMVLGSLSNHS